MTFDWLRQRWLDITIRRHVIPHKLVFAFVWMLPRRVVEIATVRCWANATSGQFDTEDATGVTVDAALRRWMRGEGGDKTFHHSEVKY